MAGAIHPADGLAAALRYVASNPEIAHADTPEHEIAAELKPELAAESSPPRFTCRDLVQQFLGKRVAMTTKYTSVALLANETTQVITADPRRIRLEITLVGASGVAGDKMTIGTQATIQAGVGQVFQFPIAGMAYLARDYWSDGDAVCQELWVLNGGNPTTITTRETLLTPLPVDELRD